MAETRAKEASGALARLQSEASVREAEVSRLAEALAQSTREAEDMAREQERLERVAAEAITTAAPDRADIAALQGDVEALDRENEAQARHIETLENHLHNAGLGYLVEPQYDDQGIPEVSEEALQNVAATIIQSQARRVRTAAMVIRMITERDGYAQGSVGQL